MEGSSLFSDWPLPWFGLCTDTRKLSQWQHQIGVSDLFSWVYLPWVWWCWEAGPPPPFLYSNFLILPIFSQTHFAVKFGETLQQSLCGCTWARSRFSLPLSLQWPFFPATARGVFLIHNWISLYTNTYIKFFEFPAFLKKFHSKFHSKVSMKNLSVCSSFPCRHMSLYLYNEKG